MGMMSAMQHNPVMKSFYQKLIAQGKHKNGSPNRLHAKNDYDIKCNGSR
jgi:hypothetical protein